MHSNWRSSIHNYELISLHIMLMEQINKSEEQVSDCVVRLLCNKDISQDRRNYIASKGIKNFNIVEDDPELLRIICTKELKEKIDIGISWSENKDGNNLNAILSTPALMNHIYQNLETHNIIYNALVCRGLYIKVFDANIFPTNIDVLDLYPTPQRMIEWFARSSSIRFGFYAPDSKILQFCKHIHRKQLKQLRIDLFEDGIENEEIWKALIHSVSGELSGVKRLEIKYAAFPTYDIARQFNTFKLSNLQHLVIRNGGLMDYFFQEDKEYYMMNGYPSLKTIVLDSIPVTNLMIQKFFMGDGIETAVFCSLFASTSQSRLVGSAFAAFCKSLKFLCIGDLRTMTLLGGTSSCLKVFDVLHNFENLQFVLIDRLKIFTTGTNCNDSLIVDITGLIANAKFVTKLNELYIIGPSLTEKIAAKLVDVVKLSLIINSHYFIAMKFFEEPRSALGPVHHLLNQSIKEGLSKYIRPKFIGQKIEFDLMGNYDYTEKEKLIKKAQMWNV